jgi:hypothetical protein
MVLPQFRAGIVPGALFGDATVSIGIGLPASGGSALAPVNPIMVPHETSVIG